MKIIGITGGVGCGKSTVLSYLKEVCGAAVYEADKIAHLLQKPGNICHKKIIEVFGRDILNEDGTINRTALGGIVFADHEKLQKLNEIVHPEVKQYVRDQIAEERNRGTKLFVLEAALLLEDGYESICGEIWYIYAKETVRRARLKASRGYSDEKISTVIAAQMPEELFRRRCSRTIDNSGDWKETCSQLKNAVESIAE